MLYIYIYMQACSAYANYLYSLVIFSLAVVENLREKSKGEFAYSFSESVHPIVPQKKNPHELGLGNFFHSTLNF